MGAGGHMSSRTGRGQQWCEASRHLHGRHASLWTACTACAGTMRVELLSPGAGSRAVCMLGQQHSGPPWAAPVAGVGGGVTCRLCQAAGGWQRAPLHGWEERVACTALKTGSRQHGWRAAAELPESCPGSGSGAICVGMPGTWRQQGRPACTARHAAGSAASRDAAGHNRRSAARTAHGPSVRRTGARRCWASSSSGGPQQVQQSAHSGRPTCAGPPASTPRPAGAASAARGACPGRSASAAPDSNLTYTLSVALSLAPLRSMPSPGLKHSQTGRSETLSFCRFQLCMVCPLGDRRPDTAPAARAQGTALVLPRQVACPAACALPMPQLQRAAKVPDRSGERKTWSSTVQRQAQRAQRSRVQPPGQRALRHGPAHWGAHHDPDCGDPWSPARARLVIHDAPRERQVQRAQRGRVQRPGDRPLQRRQAHRLQPGLHAKGGRKLDDRDGVLQRGARLLALHHTLRQGGVCEGLGGSAGFMWLCTQRPRWRPAAWRTPPGPPPPGSSCQGLAFRANRAGS